MSYEYIENHYDVAKYEVTPTQFREKLVYQAILRAITDEVQFLEDDFYAMYVKRSLNTATGSQLDNLGALLGVKRSPGEVDEDYRTDLYATIAMRRSDGTGDKILRTMMALYQSEYGQVFEHISAMTGGIVIRVNDIRKDPRSNVRVLDKISPVCIGSVAVLRDTTPTGVAWTPVELIDNNANLVDNNLSQFETDGLQQIVVDISESGLEGSLTGTLADEGVTRNELLVEAASYAGNPHLAIEARNGTGKLIVEQTSLTGGDYGFFAEVSQIRMGHTNVEGEQ